MKTIGMILGVFIVAFILCLLFVTILCAASKMRDEYERRIIEEGNKEK